MKSGSGGLYGSATLLIQQLIEFEEELEEQRHSLEFDLGLIMERERGMRDMSTPPDVIPFARAGVDGIHYGFCTDFGAIKDIGTAPIVSVSPIHRNGVWLVARNMQDFLSVVYTDSRPLTNYYPHAEDYVRHTREHAAGVRDDRKLLVRELFRERFAITPIQDMGAYISELHKSRLEQIVVATVNNLGIAALSPGSTMHRLLEINEQFSWEQKQAQVLELFTEGSLEARLAFIRDAQFYHLFRDARVRCFVAEQLRLMGLAEAAEHLHESYYSVLLEP